MKRIGCIVLLSVSATLLFAEQGSGEPASGEPGQRKRMKDKTDVYAIPLDTSPMEERVNREILERLQEEEEQEQTQENEQSNSSRRS